MGAAIGWTASSLLQAILLAPGLRRRWRPILGLRHQGVRAVFLALAPLVLANVFIRASTVVERYLASELPTGELSHVTYASRVSVALAVLLSAAPVALIFPRMAQDVASGGAAQLNSTVASSLRSLWIVVAPAVALLVALADPRRQARSSTVRSAARTRCSQRTASRLRTLDSCGGACRRHGTSDLCAQGDPGSRVDRRHRGLAYVGYTTVLTRALGAAGLALGFTSTTSVAGLAADLPSSCTPGTGGSVRALTRTDKCRRRRGRNRSSLRQSHFARSVSRGHMWCPCGCGGLRGGSRCVRQSAFNALTGLANCIQIGADVRPDRTAVVDASLT